MRKIICQEWLTIDGYAAGLNNELDFFTKPELNKYSDDDLLLFMEGIDTILLGANTYRLFVDFWPTATTDTEVIADRLNATPKIIFSKSLEQAPWGKWENATIVKEDTIEAIKNLKQEPGKNMVLWGSLSLVQSLMKENVIDEYHLRICPSVLGKGKPLFPADLTTNDMKLFETKIYDSGVVLLCYQMLTNNK